MDATGFNTALLHGTGETYSYGATQAPLYQSSAFRHDSAEELERIFGNKAMGFSYTRINNPTIEAFERKVTLLEGGIGSVACASGMAALCNALLNILRAGNEIVASAGLYGGTVELLTELENFGIRTRYVEKNCPDEYAARINANTRVLFAETIGNPKLDVTDLAGVARVAEKYKLPLIVDNTAATPYLARPIEYGAEITINSSSKYMNGNSNAISGVLTSVGRFVWDERYPGMEPYKKYGTFAYLAKLRNGLFRDLGACLAPMSAFLNLQGLETLGLRMERQCSNAGKLAEFLGDMDPAISVNYPGLETSPWRELAKRQFAGHYGALVTARCGSKERAFKIINNLKLPYIISNIGDTKTLVIHPASTIANHLSEEERISSGVYEDLIRISVGIEDIEDLKRNFEQAIQKSR